MLTVIFSVDPLTKYHKKLCINTLFKNRGRVFIFDNGPLWIHRTVIKVRLVKTWHYGAKKHDFEFKPVFGYDNEGIC